MSTVDSGLEPPLRSAAPGGYLHPRGLSGRERWSAYLSLKPLHRVFHDVPMAPGARLLAAGYVALTMLLALLAWAFELDTLRGVSTTLFLITGLGVTACLLAAPISAASFALLSVSIGLGATITVGFTMAEMGWWHPTAALFVAAAATLGGLLFAVPRDVRRWRVAGSPPLMAGSVPRPVVGLTTLGLAMIAGDAYAHRSDPTPGGLLTVVGPVWWLGVGLLIVAALVAWSARVSTALPLLSLGTVVVLSQAIAYGSPTVMAAARHVGVAEYVRAHGGLDAGSDIYQAWPGLFAAAAWIGDAAGIGDLMVLATWLPVLLTVATALAVRVLAGRCIRSRPRAWAAATLFTLANGLNIVYFSPQAVGLLLAVAVLALIVAPPIGQTSTQRWMRIGVVAWLTCVISVTHQLSPFLLAAALAALVLFRLVRPWWVPAAVLVPAAAWAVLNREVLSGFVSWRAIGRFWENATPPQHRAVVLSVPLSTRMVFLVPAAVLMVVGVFAVMAVVKRPGRLRYGLFAAAASPLSLLLATNYGQEGIFRVALFALPWLSILAVLAVSPPRSAGAAGRVIVAAAVAVLFVANGYAQTGLDWARVVRPDTAAAVRYFEETAQDGGVLLVTGTGNATPGKITERYEHVGYLSRDTFGSVPEGGPQYDPIADVNQLSVELLAWTPGVQHFALVSQSVGGWDQGYGLQSNDDYLKFAAAMHSSPLWTAVYSGPTTTLYLMTGSPRLPS